MEISNRLFLCDELKVVKPNKKRCRPKSDGEHSSLIPTHSSIPRPYILIMTIQAKG